MGCTIKLQIYGPKTIPVFDECGAQIRPIGSKIHGNQSMEENDNDDHGSSDRPTFIDNCVMLLRLGYHSEDIPDSQIFHNVTARIPVYMPMPVIDQHLHMKTQNNAARRAIARLGSLSAKKHQEVEISRSCRCQEDLMENLRE